MGLSISPPGELGRAGNRSGLRVGLSISPPGELGRAGNRSGLRVGLSISPPGELGIAGDRSGLAAWSEGWGKVSPLLVSWGSEWAGQGLVVSSSPEW